MWAVDLSIQFLSLWVGCFSVFQLSQQITSINESRQTSKNSRSEYPSLKMPRLQTAERSPLTHHESQDVVVVNGQLKRHV